MSASSRIPVSPFTFMSLASGLLAARMGMSPATTVAISIGAEFLLDPSGERGRQAALYDLAAYLAGYTVGLAVQPPKAQRIL